LIVAKSMARTGDPRSLNDSWQRIKPFMGTSRLSIGALVASSFTSGLAEAGILVLIVRIALALSSSKEEASMTLGVFGTDVVLGVPVMFAIAGGLALLMLLTDWLNAFLPARLSAQVQSTFRKSTFAAFVRSSWSVQSVEREGHLQELLTTQVSYSSQAVLYFAMGITTVFNLLALVITASVINFPAAVLVVVAGLGLFFLLRPLTMLTKRYANQQAGDNVAYANSISEATGMSQELRVFGADEHIAALVDGKVDAVTGSYFKVQYLGGLVPAIYRILALVILIAGLGALYAFGGTNVVSLSATVLILIRALSYSQNLQGIYQKITGLSPYLTRVREAEAKYLASRVTDGGRPLPRIDTVAFRDAGFSYVPGRKVLEGVDVEIDRGQFVGIVGPSGAGKSTFVQLLLRLRDPDTGLFLINGTDAREFSLDDWYQRIAFVPQDSRVLSATVAENIRFFREDITQDQVEEAAHQAHIHDEIMSWANGYETTIGQRSEAVSGGQRQRICLARALAHAPDIIVLDEPTSALDVKSEVEVQKSLEALKGKVTLFIVAHRLSTLNVCDDIMVFRNGRLDAFGPADELTISNDFFGEAVELSQLS
jgi:ATP-binding cassette subfamily B protein